LHGRYPANSASRTFEKYSTFRGSGFLAGHDGRQNIPVVRTPRKKMPSYEASFARYAPCISLVGGIVFMRSLFLESEQRFHRFLDVDFRNRLLSQYSVRNSDDVLMRAIPLLVRAITYLAHHALRQRVDLEIGRILH